MMPDKLEDLLTLKQRADYAYFNTDNPIMSDAEYDLLVERIRKLDPTHPTLQCIGVNDPNAKVTLPTRMPSLDKARTTKELIPFFKRNGTSSYIVMDKLDGVSILIHTKKDGQHSVYTRGDGVVGRDVSHLLNHIFLPPGLPADLMIRGELIIPKHLEMGLRSYSENPDSFNLRNTVSGVVNTTKGIHKHIDCVCFVPYEIVNSNRCIDDQLMYLDELGFEVVHTKFFRPGAYKEEEYVDVLSILLQERHTKGQYYIDGLVLMPSGANIDRTSEGNPDYAIAFKKNFAVEADVLDVEWQTTRYGYMKPVVHITPQVLSGVVISKLSGHNAKYIVDNKIGPGAKIAITRSGEVIPYIVAVISGTEPSLPKEYCKWNDTGVDLVISKPEEATDIAIQQISWFFATIGCEGIKEGVVSRLYHAGFRTVFDILNATPETIIRNTIEGFQQTSAKNICFEIERARKRVDLPTLMYASGVFGRGIGKKKIEMMLDKYPKIYDLLSNPGGILLLEELLDIGITEKTAISLTSGVNQFNQFLQEHMKWFIHVLEKPTKKTEQKEGKMSGKVVLFTGFRDKDLADQIEQQGGTIVTSFTRDVNLLVVKDKSSTSDKTIKARKKGIQILSKDEFLNGYI